MKKPAQHKVHAMNAVIIAAQCPDRRVSIAKVAQTVGINPQNLKIYLRRHLRITLASFRIKFKVHLAARIIECSPKTTEIGNILPVIGMTSNNLLVRHFKQEFGTDLRTYQKHFGDTHTLKKDVNLSDDILRNLCAQYFIP